MYETQTTSTSNPTSTPTSEHAPRARDSATSRTDSATSRTDPKFARESNTMRRMQPWQIGALAIAAAVVIALVVFYV